MNYEQIDYSVDEAVATLTLNRPDRLNSFTRQMLDEIIDALDRSDRDPAVRAVIVTGAGRAFCAGFEIEGPDTFEGEEDTGDPERLRDLGGLLTLRLFESLKPLIAVINGPAVGIGATMLLPMDHRIACEEARFGFVFTQRGIVPEAASSWFLPRLVGIAQALDWSLSGRIFSAVEAREGGLVSAVLPAANAIERARQIAREIADRTAPVSVALTRQMMWNGLTFDHPMEAHRTDSALIRSRGRSNDVREGIAAFLEKRAPDFPDRVPADLPPVAPWRPRRTFSE